MCQTFGDWLSRTDHYYNVDRFSILESWTQPRYLRLFRHCPWQQWPAELLLRTDGGREGGSREHGGHGVDPRDPGLHLFRIPDNIHIYVDSKIGIVSSAHG